MTNICPCCHVKEIDIDNNGKRRQTCFECMYKYRYQQKKLNLNYKNNYLGIGKCTICNQQFKRNGKNHKICSDACRIKNKTEKANSRWINKNENIIPMCVKNPNSDQSISLKRKRINE